MKYLFTLLFLAMSASGFAQEKTLEGEWTGHYQTLRAFEGKLKIQVSKEGSKWNLSVISSNEHYPQEEQETLESFLVDGNTIIWSINWGPNNVTFRGHLKDDHFMVGTIEGKQNDIGVSFGGQWIAVRKSARRR
ncbi:hypothetical protein GWK08_06180 [Leptobacterium flavescens]|uniref:Lipocalin-like domain-containing protein n=1 Tax=Leptobacterium flavescens TaxID=472055 RepID=A0A6P0UMC1_9FLAO|nr:hypothetical protein [Leptobacterium flavescens]NER13018.1 hypothetical protein [Leptobacterium flavescens]